MSKAKEIAETRLAKGEITGEEFLSIIESLENHSASQTGSENPASIYDSPSSTGQAEPVEAGQTQKAKSTPEMLKHYQKSQFLSDLSFPAKIVDHTVVILIVFYIYQITLLFKNKDNPEKFNEWFGILSGSTNDPVGAMLFFVSMIPELIVMVAGLVWIYRANKNLFFLKVSYLKISPGWSVGWFFIPLAFLWMPLKAAHQIHAGTRAGDHWVKSSMAGGLIAWWVLFWLATFVAYLIPSNIASSSEINTALFIYGVYLALSAASLIFFSKDLVGETTKAQKSLPKDFPNHLDS